MIQYNCRVIHQKNITQDIFHLSLDAPEIARVAQPGQFVHLRIGQRIDPLLRRPFSIHRVKRELGQLELFYRVVGRGTALMAEAKEGESFDLVGPLGKGFQTHGDFNHALIVAGGMGSAPIFFLIDTLMAMKKQVTLLWGVRTGKEIFNLSAFEKAGVTLEVATEDGSMGLHGLVTSLLERFLANREPDSALEGFACGPTAMLKGVQGLVNNTSFSWQASLEERMACGIGVCMGCVVKTKEGGYRITCSNGPVFDLKEMILDG